jgi:cytochrome c-type biogenesis protein CcmH/NrfG
VERTSEAAGTRGALLAFAVCLAGFLCYQAGRLWLADRDTRSDTLARLERGAALEPGNADAWDALGRFRQLDFTNPDSDGALADYQRSVQANPLSAHHWMNLAEAYEAHGDIAKARDAFEHARTVYPLSAEVDWNYGNFLLRQDESAQGYTEIQHAVYSDPKLLTLAISRTWRSSRDVNILLDKVLPAQTNAYLLAIDYFATIKQMEPALVVWQRMVALGKPIEVARSFPFLDELIAEDRSTDAKKVWIDALALAGLNHDDPLNHSVLWNGDFARDFLQGGLDWRWTTLPGVDFEFDTVPQNYGVRSAQLFFGGGSNVEITEPKQYVPVEPGRWYRFHAYMRTQALSTEMGTRFLITDPNHLNAVRAKTDNFSGSHPWTATDLDIQTSANTHFLLVQLLREQSHMFDNKLSGTMWIADLSLTPSTGPALTPASGPTEPPVTGVTEPR